MRLPERNHVVAIDLARGSQRWRLPFESGAERRMLTGVVQQGPQTWMRIGSLPRDENALLPAPVLAELSVGLGASMPLDVVRLSPEDVILGLPRDTRVSLPEGPLFVLSPRGGRSDGPREARLRAIDPRRGELWAQPLQNLSFDDLRGSRVQAAWSDRAVVIATPLYDGRQRPARLYTLLHVFERDNGTPSGVLEVTRSDKSDVPELHAFGETLLIRRNSGLEFLR
jgi:hypothetical protein